MLIHTKTITITYYITCCISLVQAVNILAAINLTTVALPFNFCPQMLLYGFSFLLYSCLSFIYPLLFNFLLSVFIRTYCCSHAAASTKCPRLGSTKVYLILHTERGGYHCTCKNLI